MDRRELEEIERFLSTVGQPTLLAYYGLSETSTPEDREAGVKKRRAWAQGQQANPKFKAEALFLIKNNAMLKRLLVDDFGAYQQHFIDTASAKNVDELSQFIRGALANAVLTAQGEAAVRHHGRNLGLSDSVVTTRINEMLAEMGAVRGDFEEEAVPGSAAAVDYYALLDVSPFATPMELEAAYRAKYRWARNVKDLKRSSEVISQLDDAWRILKDASKRQRYDEMREQLREVTEEVERHAAKLNELLEHERQNETPATPPPISMDPPTEYAPRPPEPRQPEVKPPESRTPARPPEPRQPEQTPDPRPPDPRPTRDPADRRPTEPSQVFETRLPTGGNTASTTNGAPDSASPFLAERPIDVVRTPDAMKEARENAPLKPKDAPVPQISGRTIGLADGPQAVRERAPRLQVQGLQTVKMTVGRRTSDYGLQIVNVGQGKMPGRLVSDSPWLVPQKLWLEAGSRDQTIVVSVRPERMPRRAMSGTVTVVADHGERRVITFEVRKRGYVVPLLVLLMLVCAVGIAAIAVQASKPPAAPLSAALLLTIDPYGDHVLVDGVEAGKGKSVTINDPHDGAPFRLRIETDGFAPHEELVSLRGSRMERTIRLDLTDKMDWKPPLDATAAELGPHAKKMAKALVKELAKCVLPPVEDAHASFHAVATPDGQVRGLNVDNANFPVPPAAPCFRHEFRGLRVGGFEGDYALIDVDLDLPAP